VLERELPIDAHLDGQLVSLKERIETASAIASSYGVAVRHEIVRTRPGNLGQEVARVAAERRAELVVVGAPGLPPRLPARASPAAARRPVPRDDRHGPSCGRGSDRGWLYSHAVARRR